MNLHHIFRLPMYARPCPLCPRRKRRKKRKNNETVHIYMNVDSNDDKIEGLLLGDASWVCAFLLSISLADEMDKKTDDRVFQQRLCHWHCVHSVFFLFDFASLYFHRQIFSHLSCCLPLPQPFCIQKIVNF